MNEKRLRILVEETSTTRLISLANLLEITKDDIITILPRNGQLVMFYYK